MRNGKHIKKNTHCVQFKLGNLQSPSHRSNQKIQLCVCLEFNCKWLFSFSRNVSGWLCGSWQQQWTRRRSDKTRILVWLISFVRDYMATYLDAAIAWHLSQHISYTFIRNYYIFTRDSSVRDWAVSVQLSSSLVSPSHIIFVSLLRFNTRIFSLSQHVYYFYSCIHLLYAGRRSWIR